MSSRRIESTVGAVMLRITLIAAALASTGCAYFHPAFITNATPLSAPSTTERGVLVCERTSFKRQECVVMPYSDVSRMLSQMSGR